MARDTSCTNEQKVRVRAVPVTAAGNPAPLDGPLQCMVQLGEGTTEPDPADANAVWLISGVGAGDTVYLISGDADMGSGVQTITETITLHVSGAAAASLGMTIEPPVLK